MPAAWSHNRSVPSIDYHLNPFSEFSIEDEERRHHPVDDVPRKPEPQEHPDGAQWDEVRGVWVRWDEDAMAWVDVPPAPDAPGTDV